MLGGSMTTARTALSLCFLLLTVGCYISIWRLPSNDNTSIATTTSALNTPHSASMAQPPTTRTCRRADIVIIGGGLAGLVASLEATALDPTLSIVLVEKEPKLGGNSAKASSGINAALDDTDVPVFQHDTLKSGGGLSVEPTVAVFVDQSRSAIAFLEQRGVDLSVLCQLGGHSAKRTHRNANGPNVGFAIVSTLQKAIGQQQNGSSMTTKPIDVVTGASVTKLRIAANGSICGLEITRTPSTATGAAAEREDIDAPVVILATGGFSANRELLAKVAPGMESFPTTNGPWATGDGVALAQALGADVRHMSNVQLHPTAFINPKDRDARQKFLAPEAIRGSGALLLNTRGERFVDELATRDRVAAAILAQPERRAFLVLFDGAAPLASSLGFYKHIGVVTVVSSVQEAAAFCGFKEANALLQELDAYAAAAAGTQRDRFGKTVFPFPLTVIDSVDSEVEIHVMEVAPAVHYTMGGVKTNERAQVLRADDSVIDGLFAAGEVAGGLHGANRLGGNSLAECVVFGRIAAQQAVQMRQQQAQAQAPRTSD